MLARKTTYADTENEDFFVVREIRQAVESQLEHWRKSAPGKDLLDLGCGAQPFRAAIQKAGFHYFSADYHATPNAEPDFVFAADGDLPPSVLRHGPFSLILCTEVVEHISDWPRAFANFATLLKPGGEIFLTSPFVYPRHEEPHDFFRATPHAFREWARRSGLEITTVTQAGNFETVLGTVAGNALRHFRYVSGSDSWLNRLKQRFRLMVLRTLWKLCRRGWFGPALDHVESLYLTNLVRLRKPG